MLMLCRPPILAVCGQDAGTKLRLPDVIEPEAVGTQCANTVSDLFVL